MSLNYPFICSSSRRTNEELFMIILHLTQFHNKTICEFSHSPPRLGNPPEPQEPQQQQPDPEGAVLHVQQRVWSLRLPQYPQRMPGVHGAGTGTTHNGRYGTKVIHYTNEIIQSI